MKCVQERHKTRKGNMNLGIGSERIAYLSGNRMFVFTNTSSHDGLVYWELTAQAAGHLSWPSIY